MKWLSIIALFVFGSLSAQIRLKKGFEKTSDISGVIGNNNIVTVVQGNGNKVMYNLLDEKQASSFLEYLNTIPNINEKIKRVLQYNEKILTLVKKIYEKTNDAGLFNIDKFFEKLDTYTRDNERLRIDNEALKRKTTDNDFSETLAEADKKLKVYDNEGYNDILEKYKNKKKKEIAKASYLQSRNNYANYNYTLAISQIEEALAYDKDNGDYLFLKAEILIDLAKYDESLATYYEIVALNIDDTLRSSSYSDMGHVFHKKNDYDSALVYSLKALNIQEKIFGKEHYLTSTSYNNIGTILIDQDEYDKALEYFEKDLAINEKTFGKTHPTITSYANIGSVYYKKEDYDKASEYFETALNISERFYGKEHPLTGLLYSDIAAVYKAKSNFTKALEYYNMDLDICERIFGKNHPNTAGSYDNLGSLYHDKGNYDKAIEYHIKALTIFEKIYGIEHSTTALSYTNIGLAYRERGNYDTALLFFKKAIAITERLFGKEHSSTADNYNNIATVYFVYQNWDFALEYFLKYSTFCEKKFGKENRSMASTYNNIGMIYLKKGNYDQSLEYLEKTVIINEKIYANKENVETAISYNNIADAYAEKEVHEKALDYYNRALIIYENILGHKAQETKTVFVSIGLIHISNGDIQKGLTFLMKSYFSDQPSNNKCAFLNTKGFEKFKKGKYNEAINFYKTAFTFLEGTNIEEANLKQATIYHNMANAYCADSQKEIALTFFRKALSLCKNAKSNFREIKENYKECRRR